MHILIHFFLNGIKTYRAAARGEYSAESDAIKALRQEMFAQPDVRNRDAASMRRDRMQVGRDVRVSFDEIVASNG